MLNSLNVAQSGLIASKTQVENVMNNIANENTEGYKKRVVDVKEAEHSDANMTGRGAELVEATRITNIYMYDNLMDENSRNAQYDELSTMLSDIESLFFETEDSGMSADLDRFFQAIEDLRSNPYNEIYRTNLINVGNVLADNLKNIYNEIEDREFLSNQFLEDHINEVNGILDDIGRINQEIQNALVPQNDLLDKRDQLEKQLSEYFEITVDRSESYSLSIGGVTAVRYSTNVHDIRIVSDDLAQKDIYADVSNSSTLVDGSFDELGDSVTYSFNKDHKISVEWGELVDGYVVDSSNIVQALTYKINNDPHISNYVEAFNGAYSIDVDGTKIPKSPTTTDHYLIVESKDLGLNGSFDAQILVQDATIGAYISEKNELKSVKATNDTHLEVFDKELVLESGKLKPLIDNINTNASSNYYDTYKGMLDNFAKQLSDITESYIFVGENEYVYGEKASNLDTQSDKARTIGLFEGADVKTLSFNDDAVRKLTQEDLDYLATIHWSEDIEFEAGSGNTTSFSNYYQNIRVQVSSDKENIDYLKETQEAVTESLQLTYDKLTKVDKDEEMVNLIKFQAAYEANAKIITVVDEMLATILGMKS